MDSRDSETPPPAAALGRGARLSRSAIYLLPNLFTTAALASGFYSITESFAGRWQNAALAIFAAMILDSLDGRIARMTKTQSAFGVIYDSLSDVVAFGVAPALLFYFWGLSALGKIGWAAALVYCACAALRLARFSIRAGASDKRFFVGLPSPAAAGAAAALAWTCAKNFESTPSLPWLFVVAAVACALGLTMVSELKYHSFKDLGARSRLSLRSAAALTVIFGVLYWLSEYLAEIALLLFGGYWISGCWLWAHAAVRRARRAR